MKTKKFLKLIILTTIILLMTLLLTGGTAKAALQSNPSTSYTRIRGLKVWVTEIRQMEATGGAMGLGETINTDGTPTTSNGIDVHCIKSTEYGAMAILSASGYGNPDPLVEDALDSTTGNDTGVMLNVGEGINCAGLSSDTALGVDSRYYNLYTSAGSTVVFAGDALGSVNANFPGCVQWHGGGSGWFSEGSSNVNYYVSRRAMTGLFGYAFAPVQSSQAQAFYGLGVAVCGEGL